jgi:multidrug efflux pump subunit AcrA (membrane-fusion protein)
MDVPENDNTVVAPGAILSAKIPSVERTLVAKVSRRVASADPVTRTIHVESDMPNADRTIPVETTADVEVHYGDSIAAVAIPVSAATVRGGRATIFAIEGNIARKRTLDVLNETEGWLFVPPNQVGTLLVVEGRSLLHDGDKVDATLGGAQ